MKWYEFSQNNSGGSFAVDDKLCHRVFIEAETIKDAIDKAKDIGIYFNGVELELDCPCCGDRWYQPRSHIDIETLNESYTKTDLNTIEDYAKYLANNFGGWTSPEARLFYSNGRVLEVMSERE